jgi:hypothetical protein
LNRIQRDSCIAGTAHGGIACGSTESPILMDLGYEGWTGRRTSAQVRGRRLWGRRFMSIDWAIFDSQEGKKARPTARHKPQWSAQADGLLDP